jgi:hypothetical protein
MTPYRQLPSQYAVDHACNKIRMAGLDEEADVLRQYYSEHDRLNQIVQTGMTNEGGIIFVVGAITIILTPAVIVFFAVSWLLS